jgi:hypothetical protein
MVQIDMKKTGKTKHRELVTHSLDHEIALINQNPDLLAFLEQRSKPAKTFTLDQVRETLGLN